MQLKLSIYFMHWITNTGLEYFGIGLASKAKLHKKRKSEYGPGSLLLSVTHCVLLQNNIALIFHHERAFSE